MKYDDIKNNLLRKNSLDKNGIIPIKNSAFYNDRKKPKVSLEFCAELFDEINGKVIVKVGTGLQGELSGNSMNIWTRQTKAENIYAVDLDQKQIDTLEEIKKKYKNVTLINDDAFNFIETLDTKIDLLYLDYWVSEEKEKFFGEARAKSYLSFYKRVGKLLNKTSMILIDDTDHISPWKHTYIIPEAIMDGFQVIYTGRQTMLVRIK